MNLAPGQLLITGLSGTELSDEEREFISKEDIGGVILFSRNYSSPSQLGELVNDIQKCRSEYPLLVSVDHEGGRVQRFKDRFSSIPPMRELGEKGSPKVTYEVHQLIAEELLSCGVNLNYSPVCDVLLEKKQSDRRRWFECGT